MKIVIVFCLIFIINFAYSQNCNCKEVLINLQKKVSQNYAGFEDKVTSKTKTSYFFFLKKLEKNALKTNGFDCYKILSEYINFFNDKHLTVNINITENQESLIDSFYQDTPKMFIDTLGFKNKRKKDSIEGIWRINNRNYGYRILIVKIAKDKYKGVVLNAQSIFWKPWQIKMYIKKKDSRYNIKFLQRNHISVNEDVIYRNNKSFNVFGTNWIKEEFFNIDSINIKKEPIVFFKKLSNKTNLLTLKSFEYQYTDLINSIINDNDSIIKNTDNLIIDIRDNLGGTTASYNNLIKYFYSKPIKEIKAIYKSSIDNINYYKKLIIDTSISFSYKEYLKKLVTELEFKIGQMVYYDSSASYISLDSSLSYPKKVAILYNRKSMSTSEIFILNAKESEKVTTYGENSGGAIDYVNMKENNALNCNLFTYSYAMVKSLSTLENYFDHIGIKPKIKLIGDESNWINKVQNKLELK